MKVKIKTLRKIIREEYSKIMKPKSKVAKKSTTNGKK